MCPLFTSLCSVAVLSRQEQLMEAARKEAQVLHAAAAAATSSAEFKTAAAHRQEEQLSDQRAGLLNRLQELEEREVSCNQRNMRQM